MVERDAARLYDRHSLIHTHVDMNVTSMGARRKLFRGGGASPKKGPHHRIKSSKKALTW